MSHNRYTHRQQAIAAFIDEAGLDGIILEDTEGRRNSAIRYLTGLPQDGLLFVFRTGETVLVPWDIIMARKTATASRIVPLTDFERKIEKAIRGVLDITGFGPGTKLELSAATPHPLYMKLREKVPEAVFNCPERGVEHRIDDMRSRKDPDEQAILRQAATATNTVLQQLVETFEKGAPLTELEAAMMIETAGRELGSEGQGFETIAAGPDRSFGIHALPAFTNAPIGTEGLSIIDFGFSFGGYTSDVTITIARGNLSEKQERMVELVNTAYTAAVEAAGPGVNIREICRRVDDVFSAASFSMPHSLGHGIGLDAHEAPLVSTRADEDAVLEPGMVITIEPGLYAEDTGGVRLENDLLITEGGAEVLTMSRILRLP